MRRAALARWPHWSWLLWIAYAAVLAVLELLLPHQTQNPTYHAFADTRQWLGIPRFGDVASNLAILAAGLAGLAVVRRRQEPSRDVAVVQAVFFAGIVFTAFGSAYYHWAPDSARLVWDRLPIGLVTACFPAFVLVDRTSLTRPSRWALWAWLAWGLLSVLYWRLGDAEGAGNLRPYSLMKLYGISSCLVLLGLLARRHTFGALYVVGIALYVLAGIAEARDTQIYGFTGWISGHTLKHLLAALGVAALVGMVAWRRALPNLGNRDS